MTCGIGDGEEAKQRLAVPGDASGEASGSGEPKLDPVHREWYSRGYLPHSDHPGLLQAITYRLADSLPADLRQRLNAELRHLPPNKPDAERRKRMDALLDAGYGSCVLRLPEAAACVVENWRHFGGVRYDLIAWVVMPNHVHVLIRTYQGTTLSKIVQSWKSYTGRRIGEMVRSRRDAKPEEGEPWSSHAAANTVVKP